MGVAGRLVGANDSVASSVGPCTGVSSENICLSSALSEESLLESEEAGETVEPVEAVEADEAVEAGLETQPQPAE